MAKRKRTLLRKLETKGFYKQTCTELMMWTYFSSELLEGKRLALRVSYVEGVEVFGFSDQLRLQEEEAAHSHGHAQENCQAPHSQAGGLRWVAP